MTTIKRTIGYLSNIPETGPIYAPITFFSSGRGRVIKKLEAKKKQEFLNKVNGALDEIFNNRRKKATSGMGEV